MDWPVGIPRVLRTGVSERISVVREGDLDAMAESPGHLRMLRELKIESVLTVPLWVRARVVGSVMLVHSGSGRRFTRADQAVAEDLAGRAGLAVENARLYADLQEEDRRKDEFLAMLAHELRNPLAPVQVAVQLLQQGSESRASQDHAHAVIARQTRHMARLVDDLLDLSRITRGKIELRREPTQLQALVRRAVDLAQPLLQAKRHRLTVELPEQPLWIEVDPVRIEQVLANLLNNAAKYSDPEGSIRVQAHRLGGGLEVVVRDSGIGITEEMLGSIFDLFVQEKRASDRSQGGLGIGLTLVKQLVELHGGVVSAHSDGVGKGSEFRLRLPCAVEARDDVPVPLHPSVARSMRILVVDDNVDAAETLAELLESWGHTVKAVHDGVEGLEEAQRFRPDVVLLDIGLPRMDGLEVARRLRSLPGEPRTVLVALTGYGQAEDRARSREAGFDHHLTKPVDLDTLVRVLGEVRVVEVA
jgi:signal transduction histidine kinase/ActR/RegA family two-component response regulator